MARSPRAVEPRARRGEIPSLPLRSQRRFVTSPGATISRTTMAVFPRCFEQGTAWVGWQGLAHGGASLLHTMSKHIGSGAVAAAARHPRLAASTLPPVSLVARGDYNNPPLPLRGYKPPHPPSILPMGKGPRTPTTRHRDNGLGRPQRRPTVNGQGGAAESAPIPSGRGGTAECRPPRPSR